MSEQFVEYLANRFSISEQEKKILQSKKRELKRKERKILFQDILPNTKDWVRQLRDELGPASCVKRDRWVGITVDSMLEKGGEPDISDELAMEVLGRFHVIHELRKQAERKGIMLKTLASLGGLSFILITVILITSFILLVTAHLK